MIILQSITCYPTHWKLQLKIIIQNSLRVSIYNPCYAITKEVLHSIFAAYGAIEVLRIDPVGDTIIAIIKFQSQGNAMAARNDLQGRCIYADCCQLDITFQHEEVHTVNVEEVFVELPKREGIDDGDYHADVQVELAGLQAQFEQLQDITNRLEGISKIELNNVDFDVESLNSDMDRSTFSKLEEKQFSAIDVALQASNSTLAAHFDKDTNVHESLYKQGSSEELPKSEKTGVLLWNQLWDPGILKRRILLRTWLQLLNNKGYIQFQEKASIWSSWMTKLEGAHIEELSLIMALFKSRVNLSNSILLSRSAKIYELNPPSESNTRNNEVPQPGSDTLFTKLLSIHRQLFGFKLEVVNAAKDKDAYNYPWDYSIYYFKAISGLMSYILGNLELHFWAFTYLRTSMLVREGCHGP